ncbi:MAG: LPS export ABC transporter periplasmic protein LptC [Thermodesulfobacteriota bacterium]
MKLAMRPVFIALGAAVIGGAAFLFVLDSESGVLESPKTVSITEPLPRSVIMNVRYSGASGGRKEWELTADRLSLTKDSDAAALDNVRFIYYAADGNSYTMTGKNGSYDETSGEVIATGGVKVLYGDGYTLTSSEMAYSIKKKAFHTEKPVRILSGKADVSGVGFEFLLTLQRLTVKKDVRAVLKGAFI